MSEEEFVSWSNGSVQQSYDVFMRSPILYLFSIHKMMQFPIKIENFSIKTYFDADLIWKGSI